MSCFPHPPAGTPLRRFVIEAFSDSRRSRAVGRIGPTCVGRGYAPDVLRLFRNRSDDIDVRVSRVLAAGGRDKRAMDRSEEHTSELQSLMRISYAVFCLN